MPYCSTQIHCFICKEKLKVEKDGATDQVGDQGAKPTAVPGAGGLSGILNPTSDENCYFIDAKKIRVSVKSKETGQLEKKEVTVHSECLKQLEQMKKAKQQALKEKEEAVLGKREAPEVAGGEQEKRQKLADSVKVEVKQLMTGLNQ